MSTYLDIPPTGLVLNRAFERRPRTVSQPAPNRVAADAQATPIIAFCHLSWHWVWQRPQQFLSRLARTRRVLFVEWGAPVEGEGAFELSIPEGHSNITLFRGHIPVACQGDHERRRHAQRTLVQEALREMPGEFSKPILWFNDPLAYPAMAGGFQEVAVVYDCMDELSQFKGAPPELVSCEHALVRAADVVFCGGQRMREKRLPLNPNCHFFGTGVDCAHFGQALRPDVSPPPDLAALRGPVLGYFGVVDERMDYDLLAALADARGDWSIAIVGPHAKVDPADFPKRDNLHFLGGRAYADLPAITKRFSVCLMPFALNAATEFINPTKALEYMAAGRLVVSTALHEVKANFGSVAAIAGSHAEFIDLCIRDITHPSRARIEAGLKLATANSWECILQRMEVLMGEAIADRAARNNPSARRVTGAGSLPTFSRV